MKTNSFSTILIDDEQLALNALSHLLKQNCPEIEIIQTFLNPLDAQKFLKTNHVDMAFIDIRMPGKSGLELVKSLEDSETKYIFSSAYSEYSLEAWQTKALGYILKPIDPTELIETVEKIKNIIRPKTKLEPIIIAGTELEINEVIYGESSGSYTIFYKMSNQIVTVTALIKKVMSVLPQEQFFRIRREVFINILFLESYSPKTRIAVLSNGISMTVSVRRAGEFLEFLNTNNYAW